MLKAKFLNSRGNSDSDEVAGIRCAMDLCIKGNYQGAIEKLIEGLTQFPEAKADLIFLCGVMTAIIGDLKAGGEIAARSYKVGEHTELSLRFGEQLFSSCEKSIGEKARLYFSKQRLWPAVHKSKLNPTARTKYALSDIEPWYFSRDLGSIFPRKFPDLITAEFIKKHFLEGWIPQEPIFDKDAKVFTVGSCFAEELRKYFLSRDLSSDVIFIPPGLNNSFALRKYFSWLATGSEDGSEYWYDEAKGGGIQWQPTVEREQLCQAFAAVDCVVLTLGLAEVWVDAKTQGVYWRGVPKKLFDPEKHVCRLSSVEENTVNLIETIKSIKLIAPRANIVISLSPIPLAATQTGVSCFTADCLSKSILRLAIDAVVKQNIAGVGYWPSFEIVRWLGSHVGFSLFGEDGNSRHVNRGAVDLILSAFIDSYFRK